MIFHYTVQSSYSQPHTVCVQTGHIQSNWNVIAGRFVSYIISVISQQWPHSDSASFSGAQHPQARRQRDPGMYVTELTQHTWRHRQKQMNITHSHFQFTSSRGYASRSTCHSENSEGRARFSRHTATDTNTRLSVSCPNLKRVKSKTSNVSQKAFNLYSTGYPVCYPKTPNLKQWLVVVAN